MFDAHGKLAEDGRLECAAILAHYFFKKWENYFGKFVEI